MTKITPVPIKMLITFILLKTFNYLQHIFLPNNLIQKLGLKLNLCLYNMQQQSVIIN